MLQESEKNKRVKVHTLKWDGAGRLVSAEGSNKLEKKVGHVDSNWPSLNGSVDEASKNDN